MLKSRYFLPSFFILVIVGVLHWIASFSGYYWTVWWYDIMMHFLGGAWVVLFGLWLIDSLPVFLSRFPPFVGLRNILILVLVVGVAWEVFELIMCFSDPKMPNYWPDTGLDLIMDTLGAFVVAKIYLKTYGK